MKRMGKGLAACLAPAIVLAGCVSAPRPTATDTGGVFDGHVDLMVHFAEKDYSGWRGPDSYDIGTDTPGQVDIPKLRAGNIGGGILTLAALNPSDQHQGLRDATGLLGALAARHAGTLQVVTGVDEIRAAAGAGRIALLPGIEGGEQLGDDVAMLATAHALGIRAITLTWTRTNALGDSSTGARRHGGLSPLGQDYVREMNRLGMLIDLSHAADATVADVLALSRAPVIFSHSSARAICNTPRNLPDDLMRAAAARGGIVMVSLVPYLTDPDYLDWYERGEAEWAHLKAEHPGDEPAARAAMAAWEGRHPAPTVGISDVADHIDHVRRVAGIGHVGIGTDFDGMYSHVEGLEDASRLPALMEELARRGWSPDELRMLARGNFLRVLAAVEATAVERR